MITIEEIFRRGEISFDTWNICISNQIKTFRDLKRHYIENDSFRDPRIGDGKCNDELIEVLFKYEDLNTDMITTLPEPVTENKSEVKLDDVVTDLDKVIKTNLSAKVSLEVIEKKLKEHWRKKAGNENTQINTAKFSEKATSKKDAVNLRSIEQKLEEYWSKSKEKEGIQKYNKYLTVYF